MDPYSLSIKAIGKRRSLWGEGPIWWNDSLYYVDIEGKAIIRLDPDTEAETVWEFPERIGCIAPCNNGQLLYAGDNGISIFDPQTNKSIQSQTQSLTFQTIVLMTVSATHMDDFGAGQSA